MGKGEQTRQGIVDRAVALSTRLGLEGVTIGRLAEELNLSKSGLFAHFKSKEALQIQVLEQAASEFVAAVVRPALAKPRGTPRLQALFDLWLAWPRRRSGAGCLFIQSASELDDRPGPVRDVLVRQQRDWLDTLAQVVRSGIAERHFRRGLDPDQVAFELHALTLGYHHASRLLGDPAAEKRTRAAFESLLKRIHP